MQQLSEDTQFPDNHFDLIANNLLVHAMPADNGPAGRGDTTRNVIGYKRA